MPGYKQWAAGDVLLPSELDEYLVGQTIMRFASDTARTAALPSPVAGMRSYLVDTSTEYIYRSGAWAPLSMLIQKAAAESVTTSSIQDDDHFQVQLVPGTYTLDLYASVTGLAAADIKTQWAFSGTLASNSRFCFGPGPNTTDVTNGGFGKASSHGLGSSISYGLDGSAAAGIHEHLSLKVTVAGLLKLQWAQAVGNATATVMTTDSHLSVDLRA
jgi:hypothetical protein